MGVKEGRVNGGGERGKSKAWWLCSRGSLFLMRRLMSLLISTTRFSGARLFVVLIILIRNLSPSLSPPLSLSLPFTLILFAVYVMLGLCVILVKLKCYYLC